MFGLFRKSAPDADAARIYGEIVAQARQPRLYLDYAVPDTVEGRYDMMVLHLFLVLRAIGRDTPELARDTQAVCDHFFLEMDRALREMGVGDLTVPKRMKSIAELYAGCSASYAAALASPEPEALEAALARNVYADRPGAGADAAWLAAYVRKVAERLSAHEPAYLLGRAIPFPAPDPVDRSAA